MDQLIRDNYVEIEYINYGIACRIGNKIYMNNNLDKYQKLRLAILKHELSHSSGFELKDILLDLRHNHLKGLKLEYWKFILTNPSSLTEFLPLMRYNGTWTINLLLSLFYGTFLCLLGGILWLLV